MDTKFCQYTRFINLLDWNLKFKRIFLNKQTSTSNIYEIHKTKINNWPKFNIKPSRNHTHAITRTHTWNFEQIATTMSVNLSTVLLHVQAIGGSRFKGAKPQLKRHAERVCMCHLTDDVIKHVYILRLPVNEGSRIPLTDRKFCCVQVL